MNPQSTLDAPDEMENFREAIANRMASLEREVAKLREGYAVVDGRYRIALASIPKLSAQARYAAVQAWAN